MRLALLFGFATFIAHGQRHASVCEIGANPQAFHKKQLVVDAFAFSGFENFTLQDPACEQRIGIWLEFGGDRSHDIVYCCPSPSKKRRTVVEKIRIPLVENRLLEDFYAGLRVQRGGALLRARLKGRFFATPTDRKFGYGHLGCCELFVIEEVIAVDSYGTADLDPHSSYRSHGTRSACRHVDSLKSMTWDSKTLAEYRAAEKSSDPSIFTEPLAVARRALAELLHIPEPPSESVFIDHAGPGRHEYSWLNPADGMTIKVIVSKPRWLAYYAKDPTHLPWLAIGVTKENCGRP
jgi:hypothetical protein